MCPFRDKGEDSMLSYSSEPDLLLEQHLERQALDCYRRTSLAKTLQAYHLAPTMALHTEEGETITLRATAIASAGTTFFARQQPDQDRCALAHLTNQLAT